MGRIEVCKELAEDPNFQAYQVAEKAGIFTEMEPGTWVAFSGGQLIATSLKKETLFKKLDEQALNELSDSGSFVDQVGVSKKISNIGKPRRIMGGE